MADHKARKLGRGLSSLIEDPVAVAVGEGDVRSVVAKTTSIVASATTPPAARPTPAPALPPQPPAARALTDIPVDSLIPSPFQARKEFSEAALTTLAESIRRTGLMQPVIARKSPSSDKYELVAGERRWRAAKLVGLRHIPALVKDLTDEETAEWGIVENVQREDLNPMERAWAYRMLGERFSLKQEQIAERVGQERSTVANFIRLTELEAPLRELIASGALSPGHGKALLVMQPGDARTRLGREAADNQWSVRRLEKTASEIAAAHAAGKPLLRDGLIARDGARDSTRIARESMERRLSEHLGTRVRVITRKDGTAGRIVVAFFGLDQFDGIMQRMGVGE